MTQISSYLRFESGIATIIFNRPKVHNALDEESLQRLLEIFGKLEQDPSVRTVIISAAGKNFCSGMDLAWMKRSLKKTRHENIQDALKLSQLLEVLYRFPKPTVALARGSVYGGGVGILACCDIVLVSGDARFCFPEVRLGLIPSVISPYVIRAIGPRNARRYFLSGELFDATEAHRIGLVHEIVPQQSLEHRGQEICEAIGEGGPNALSATKQLVNDFYPMRLDRSMGRGTAERLADIRSSEEAKEGLQAFFEKRKPAWTEKV